MVKSITQSQSPIPSGKRFSLRTVFFVSIAIAVPFLILANLRYSSRPEASVASPVYLLLGVAGVVLAAGVGGALGNKAGLFASAGLAAFCWVGAVYICGLFSNELAAVLPVHIVCAAATVTVLALVVRLGKKSEELEPHKMLLRLLKTKHDVQESLQTKRHHPSDAETPMHSPQSDLHN